MDNNPSKLPSRSLHDLTTAAGVRNQRHFHNPFYNRPWMMVSGAAAAAAVPTKDSSSSGGKSKMAKTAKGAVAGGITGGIEVCITFPTEYVKTQLQLQDRTGTPQYTGIWDCVKKTVKTNGVTGLYRGLSVLIYGSIPKSFFRFGTFEFLKDYRVDETGRLTASDRFLCGLGAGCSEALFAVTPMETVKVKFINDQASKSPKFKGFFHGVGHIIKTEGFRGCYQGVTATVLKQSSNQGIRFFVVESLKDRYRRWRNMKPTDPMNPLVTGVFGGIAGAASVFGNTPIDVVKTRLQGLEAKKYKNTWDCVVKIYKHEGGLAFYKGTIPRLSRVCLDAGITFAVYDLVKPLIESLCNTMGL